MIYPNPQIFHHIKTIFVHVPKAAGTSIEQTLRASSGDVVGGHTTALGFKRKYGAIFDQYFKFAFVRHPMDRFVSAYFYLAQRPVHPALGNEVVHRAGSFEKFVQLVQAEPQIVRHIVHLWPQWEFVCDAAGKLLVNEVYRFEDLPGAWDEVCKRIGIDGKSLPKANISMHQRWQSYACERVFEFVKSVYAEDFKRFGYHINCSPMKTVSGDAVAS